MDQTTLEKNFIQAHQNYPFFYLLTPVPHTFLGKELFFELPYRKGPPSYFVDGIHIALSETISLIFEGPKTPEFRSHETPKFWQSCFDKQFRSFRCKRFVTRATERHQKEMRGHPTITFFQENTLIGFRMEWRERKKKEIRYTLLLPHGPEQSVILKIKDASMSSAHSAEHLVSTMIAESASFQDLSALRAYSREVLRLQPKFQSMHNMLMSAISTSPDVFDSYYHIVQMLHNKKEPLFQKNRENARNYAYDINQQLAQQFLAGTN